MAVTKPLYGRYIPRRYLAAHDTSAPPRDTHGRSPSLPGTDQLVLGDGGEKSKNSKTSTGSGLFAGVGGLFGDGKLRRRTSIDHEFGEPGDDSDDEMQARVTAV